MLGPGKGIQNPPACGQQKGILGFFVKHLSPVYNLASVGIPLHIAGFAGANSPR